MTWPFENDTSSVVKKLANRSMRADKRSRLLLLFTIALSVCMVFSIILISSGLQEKYKNTQRNKAQIGILGITDEQSERLLEKEDVLWIGEYSAIGLFYVENEIMLPQNYIDYLGKSYQAGDTVSLDLTGTGREAEYVLSGILNDTKESDGYFIYVNKELARSLSENMFQVTAYTRLGTKAISSGEILDFAEAVIQDTGIVKEQINLTEYFAVMSGAIKSGIPIPVPVLAALTAVLAATIVYGVFYTKIVKNVQMFGRLRTIGMTKKQMKRMAGKEGRLYALTGIPIGLATGILIGFAGCPDGFRVKTAVLYAVLVAAAAFLTVNIAIFKPVRVAMHTSPVEGTRYLAYTGKVKNGRGLHRRFTPFNLAKINIQRRCASAGHLHGRRFDRSGKAGELQILPLWEHPDTDKKHGGKFV